LVPLSGNNPPYENPAARCHCPPAPGRTPCRPGQQGIRASVLLSSAIYEEEVSGNLDKAIELYLDILKKYPDDRPAAAKALYHLGLVNEKMGKQKAGEYFTRLVKTYPDQKELVSLAKAKLTRIDSSTSEATLKAEQSFRLAGDLFKQFKYESAWKEISNSLELLNLKCSPDGNWIAIQGYDNKIAFNCNMYLINAADGKATELAANDTETKEIIIWSPDSKWISFYSEGPKKMRLEGALWEADLTGFMNNLKPF